MLLHLVRIYKGPKYTIGKLYINSSYFCDTLEDTDRHLSNDMEEKEIIRQKMYSKTAIPTGTYRIAMDIVSSKFSSKIWARPYDGQIPTLLNVKGFDRILIHPGNDEDDTSGCLLVGQNKVVGQVINSQAMFHKLMQEYLVPCYNSGEEIKIAIE